MGSVQRGERREIGHHLCLEADPRQILLQPELITHALPCRQFPAGGDSQPRLLPAR